MSTKRKAKPAARKKKPERALLFPTEPSTIGDEVIRRAVLEVIAERRAAEKAAASRNRK